MGLIQKIWYLLLNSKCKTRNWFKWQPLTYSLCVHSQSTTCFNAHEWYSYWEPWWKNLYITNAMACKSESQEQWNTFVFFHDQFLVYGIRDSNLATIVEKRETSFSWPLFVDRINTLYRCLRPNSKNTWVLGQGDKVQRLMDHYMATPATHSLVSQPFLSTRRLIPFFSFSYSSSNRINHRDHYK